MFTISPLICFDSPSFILKAFAHIEYFVLCVSSIYSSRAYSAVNCVRYYKKATKTPIFLLISDLFMRNILNVCLHAHHQHLRHFSYKNQSQNFNQINNNSKTNKSE